MAANMVSAPSICLLSTMADGIFSILSAGSFTFLLCLASPSQKGKHCNQYEISVAFSRTLYGPFVLNTSSWAIPSFIFYLICYLTKKMPPVSNSLVIFPLLRSSLCLILISETRMLNSALF